MSKYARRSYVVRNDIPISAEQAEVIVKVGGKTHTHIQMRTPGMVAIVSRPDKPNEFSVEIVEQAGQKFIDRRVPADQTVPMQWQKDALGI